MADQLSGSYLVLTAGLLAGVAGLLVQSGEPPPVRGRDAPGTSFSAERAQSDIATLVALGPRPLNVRRQPPAPAHESARDLLLERMRQLGLSPQLQSTEICEPNGDCWQVENLLGRLDPQAVSGGQLSEPAAAPAKNRAVLLLSHYDSVAAGPGAGDAASGVGVVLEIARALRESRSLRRPLLVVLDDGEEVGLLGARAFLQHPWAQEVGAILNFEARGTAGQTAMFETSERSAWLVELYRDATIRPVASSVIYTLYRMLPNDTDLTITKAAGIAGLNFAFADADWNYHTSRDDLEHLDLRSVQHMGDQGLGVARALTELAELPQPSDQDAVWFDLFTHGLVVYRASLARGLALGLAIAYLAVLGLLCRRRRGRGILEGLGRQAMVTLGAVLGGQLVHKAIAGLAGRPRPWREVPLPTFTALLAVAVVLGSGSSLLVDWLRSRRSADGDAAGQLLGALVPFLAAAVVLSWRAVGASYPFTLPALAFVIPMGLLLLKPGRTSVLATWMALLPGLLATALLWFPLLRVVRVMVGAQLAVGVTVPAALVLGLFEMQAGLYRPRARLIAVGVATIVLLISVGWAAR